MWKKALIFPEVQKYIKWSEHYNSTNEVNKFNKLNLVEQLKALMKRNIILTIGNAAPYCRGATRFPEQVTSAGSPMPQHVNRST